jgi:hypothetical protein
MRYEETGSGLARNYAGFLWRFRRPLLIYKKHIKMIAFIPGAPHMAYCLLVNVTRVAATDACYLSGLARGHPRSNAVSLGDFYLSMYNHLQQHRPSCHFSRAA